MNDENINDQVNEFSSFFKERLGEINRINVTKSSYIYKNSVSFIILDTLSAATCPNFGYKENRERFTMFISKFSDWEEGRKISLPLLVRSIELAGLEGNSIIKNNKVMKYKIQLDQWYQYKNSVPIDLDIPLEVVKDVFKQEKIPINKLEYLQHYHLLYDCRNSLLHNMRMWNTEIDSDWDQPFYYKMCQGSKVCSGFWQLFHPPVWVINLTFKCIRNVKQYFLKEKIDPYEIFRKKNIFQKEDKQLMKLFTFEKNATKYNYKI